MTSTSPFPATPGDDASPAEGRRTGRGFVTSYGTGRTCATAGCETMLSRYNAAGSCALHSMRVGSDRVSI